MEEEVADFFWQVTDYRVEGRYLHELSDIIWLVLCGLLADCEDFEQIYHYTCDKQAVLARFLSLPTGIPSSYTLQRVFSRLNPIELAASLTHWGRDILRVLAGQQLAIAGRAGARHLPGQRQASVQLVRVWATAQRLCLDQTQMATKANELVAIAQVLDLVEVADSVVSIDASGCQCAIAATLVERRTYYVLALKQNQRALFE
ncbi:MAG: ISAs1 family transposase [Hymenobacter sp.]|nr:MAG: ISAs1 family transposase [Hymenobacter sp.]